jgi:UDP-glucuronate 4-epimerase
MRILVTGGAGFIGSHLCERLLGEGNEVVCVDDFNDFYNPKIKEKNISECKKNANFRVYKADIRNKKNLENIFKKEKIELIVHLAARAGVRPSILYPQLYADVNILGTMNLLELACKNNVKKFVFGSSSSVYGLNKKVPFNEEDSLDSMVSPYAITKYTGERLCYRYHKLSDIPMVCLRFFTVYGPRGRPDMAVYKFTRLINENKKIEMYGDGTSKRDYTYFSDIIDGIVSAMIKKFDFEIINLGDSNPVELKYLIKLIEKNIGKKALIKKSDVQPGDVPVTYADIRKAKKLLGYRPKIKIEEGIKRFVKWYLKEAL